MLAKAVPKLWLGRMDPFPFGLVFFAFIYVEICSKKKRRTDGPTNRQTHPLLELHFQPKTRDLSQIIFGCVLVTLSCFAGQSSHSWVGWLLGRSLIVCSMPLTAIGLVPIPFGFNHSSSLSVSLLPQLLYM